MLFIYFFYSYLLIIIKFYPYLFDESPDILLGLTPILLPLDVIFSIFLLILM